MYNPIDEFISDYNELKLFLLDNHQISLENNIENYLKKVMLLSCASYYENEIQDIIRAFVKENSDDEKLICFVSNKAIARQYHTYFSWDGNNINSFLGLFGSHFKEKVSKEIKENDLLEKQMKAFLEIGRERNKMVHENFLSYNLIKTFDEIIELRSLADVFIAYLKKQFLSENNK